MGWMAGIGHPLVFHFPLQGRIACFTVGEQGRPGSGNIHYRLLTIRHFFTIEITTWIGPIGLAFHTPPFLPEFPHFDERFNSNYYSGKVR